MVWSELDADNAPRYVKKIGSNVFLSRSKDGALEEVPAGWQVVKGRNGRLKVIPDKS